MFADRTAPDRHPSPSELQGLIRGVARSFALSLRWLPLGVRAPVGLAYLLARASDTVADSMDEAARDPDQRAGRLHALDALRNAIQALAQEPPTPLPALAPAMALLGPVPKASERRLLQRLDALLEGLRSLPADDRRRIAEVCDAIVSGQRLDLQRFDHATEGLHALEHSSDVVDYTWRVAGCVGHFWSDTCEAHVPLWRTRPLARMKAEGGGYGMGLQRLNLLRDTAQDLSLGRCYWPIDELASVGLTPGVLARAVQTRDAQALESMRPLMTRWIEQTRVDLSHGVAYALAVRPWRLRWTCALPALLGLRTLRAIEQAGPMALTRSVKLPRRWVYGLMVRLLLGGLRAPALKHHARVLGATPLACEGESENGTIGA